MTAFLVALVATTLAVSACAEDVLLAGGLSPDKRFEVRIANRGDNDESSYAIQIHAAKRQKPFYTLEEIGGFLRFAFAKEDCRAVWHPSGDFVAVTDRGTRHSREIYLFEVSADRARRLPQPDYVRKALSRVGAKEVGLHSIATPKGWQGDNFLLDYYFTVDWPERGRRGYTCDVTLKVTSGRKQRTSVSLARITQPKESEG